MTISTMYEFSGRTSTPAVLWPEYGGAWARNEVQGPSESCHPSTTFANGPSKGHGYPGLESTRYQVVLLAQESVLRTGGKSENRLWKRVAHKLLMFVLHEASAQTLNEEERALREALRPLLGRTLLRVLVFGTLFWPHFGVQRQWFYPRERGWLQFRAWTRVGFLRGRLVVFSCSCFGWPFRCCLGRCFALCFCVVGCLAPGLDPCMVVLVPVS